MIDIDLRREIFEIVNKNCELDDSGGYCVLMDDISDEILLLIKNILHDKKT